MGHRSALFATCSFCSGVSTIPPKSLLGTPPTSCDTVCLRGRSRRRFRVAVSFWSAPLTMVTKETGLWVLLVDPIPKSECRSIPGLLKGSPMDYPTLPIGFQTGHPLEGPGRYGPFFGTSFHVVQGAQLILRQPSLRCVGTPQPGQSCAWQVLRGKVLFSFNNRLKQTSKHTNKQKNTHAHPHAPTGRTAGLLGELGELVRASSTSGLTSVHLATLGPWQSRVPRMTQSAGRNHEETHVHDPDKL